MMGSSGLFDFVKSGMQSVKTTGANGTSRVRLSESSFVVNLDTTSLRHLFKDCLIRFETISMEPQHSTSSHTCGLQSTSAQNVPIKISTIRFFDPWCSSRLAMKDRMVIVCLTFGMTCLAWRIARLGT